MQPRWRDLIAVGRSPAILAVQNVTDRISTPVRYSQSRPIFEWFDYGLKGAANGVLEWPTVPYMMADQPDRELKTLPICPPVGTTATELDLTAPVRALTLDPVTPAPTLGNNHQMVSAGMLDQTRLLVLANVLDLPGTTLPIAKLLLGAASVEIRSRALTDLAKLRELEAERAATQERLGFYRSKADWVQDRIKKGYEGDVDKLWAAAQQQNSEAAAVQRLELLISAQRRQVAHTAGAQWEPLFKYLADQGRLPP